MTQPCQRIQAVLLAVGPRGLQTDSGAQEHLAECEACFACLEAQAELQLALQNLPEMDAPDPVVETLLSQVAAGAPGAGSPAVGARVRWRAVVASLGTVVARALGALHGVLRPRWKVWATAGGLAVSGLFAMFVVLSPRMGTESPDPTQVALRGLAKEHGESFRDAPEGSSELRESEAGNLRGPASPTSGAVAPAEEGAKDAPPPPGFSPPRRPAAQAAPPSTLEDKKMVDRLEGAGAGSAGEADLLRSLSEAEPQARLDSDGDDVELYASYQRLNQPVGAYDARSEGLQRELENAAGLLEPGKASRLEVEKNESQDEGAQAHGRRARSNRAHSGRVSGVDPNVFYESIERPGSLGDREQTFGADSERELEPSPDALRLARDFLAGRDRVDDLVRQPAEGYWSNAYVPGDPALRLLRSRLLRLDRSGLELRRGSPVSLHDGSRQTAQPFDLPVKSAMALYLHADRQSAGETGRMMVQVGLQATDRRSGRRPALNLALVLDLSEEIPVATASALRALVLELAESRDLGDRFHLVVAGRPGARLAGPEAFRHGPLSVALDQLFGLGGSTGPTLDLVSALESAVTVVAENDDPNAPLGSSVVLLATPRPWGDSTSSLARLAHASAVAGVPVGVIGVGDAVDRAQLDRVALAGQGHRRLLTNASEAPGLVNRVLSDVSRAVARALRLRIRLAPGVELIEVLGSNRLDDSRAEAVREAERSIDLRLARNLGIEADRGEDEEGIQIVIPSFYTGDAHVVLLDVVVNEPGPVADVTLRYKDLVHLRNGVSRAHLSLDRGDRPRGPLEINVLKNQLAYRLFETLEAAGRWVEAGNPAAAKAQLESFARLLEGLRAEVPALTKDPDVAADLAMLAEYTSLLQGDDPGAGVTAELADSLRYAARLKILPQPIGEDE